MLTPSRNAAEVDANGMLSVLNRFISTPTWALIIFIQRLEGSLDIAQCGCIIHQQLSRLSSNLTVYLRYSLRHEITHNLLSGVYIPYSKSLTCRLDFDSFTNSFTWKTILVSPNIIWLIFNMWIACSRCPDNKTSRPANFMASSLSDNCVTKGMVFTYARTILTSPVPVYRCKLGRCSNTYFMKRVIKGWQRRATPFCKEKTDDSALWAVFIQL